MGKNFRVLPIGLIGLKKSNLRKSVAFCSHCYPLVIVAHWSHPLYSKLLFNCLKYYFRITAVEVAMAATVELALFMGLIILVACNFHFHKWVGPVFVATYCICLPIVLAAGLGAFGVMPF